MNACIFADCSRRRCQRRPVNEDEIEKSRLEKESLNALIRENENKSKDAEKSVALALEKEKNELKERIAKMEAEPEFLVKANLGNSIRIECRGGLN